MTLAALKTAPSSYQTHMDGFFSRSLAETDPVLFAAMENELHRQQNYIELIASENIVSQAVLEAQGSVLTNKYAEGYPGARYYAGNEFVDIAENLAIERACQLFNCTYANVQPHSGSQANQTVYMALLQPGDTLLGMTLADGGHLTHGAAPNQSGKWFNAVQYGVRADDELLDYEQIARLAEQHKPKLIIAGATAYSRVIDWARFRAIADSVGAYLMADIAHYSGLIAAGVYPSPFPHAHVVATTTHKTLRGPRGGMVLTNDDEIAKKLKSAVFPALQGGPLMHVIAAKAAAFGEALKPEFKQYCQDIIANSRALADTLVKGGIRVVSGGTDSHMLLVDLQPKGVTGKLADLSLHHAHITCNKNMVPNDPQKPFVTSGLRVGTPAATTRGFGIKEFQQVGEMMVEVIDGLSANQEDNSAVEQKVAQRAIALCQQFPIY